jgi:hypothetical protein
MANPFSITPANPMQALMGFNQGYEGAHQRTKEADLAAARQKAAQAIQSGANPQSVLAELMGAGDVQGAATYATMQRAQAQDAFQRSESVRQQGNADRSFELQQQQLNRDPESIRVLRATGVDPASPQGRKLLHPKTDAPISTADKKEVWKSEDEKPAVQGTIESLGRALELNPKVFSGYGAGALGSIGSKLPGAGYVIDQDRAKATLEWQKMMSPEALQNMADTLKGATTDFELRKFTEMLADPETPPDIRERVIGRLKTLADRKMKIIDRRVNELRAGTYFNPGEGQPARPATAGDISSVPAPAIQALRQNPRLAEDFDAKYGVGAAARVLRVQQ